MNLTKTILVGAAAICGLMTANAGIVINEVMQSNVYSLMDDLNDFPDSWVELYNAGDESVNLSGYRMHTKDKFKSAYKLPAVILAPGQYYILYCDKVGEGQHADFRVDSGKGDIYLFDSEGNAVDHITLKKQPAPEVAYGRATDGTEEWGYELVPTPGNPNTGGITENVLGNVTFSTPGGVWREAKPMEITLSLPKKAPADAQIIYTTNGSEPTMDNSTVYTEPIVIESSTVIRAKAIADGYVSIPSDAQSYIFHDRDIKLPIVSIAINEEYLYDDAIGIFAKGLIGELNENYRQDWRRPINIEYFEGEGTASAINQLCETRVHGGMSRTNKLKSLAVYANKRFGTKNFGYEFWPNDKPGINSSSSFILRNAGNDFDGCYMRDGLIQRVIGRNTEIDWQGYSPVVVYINGKYHAMMALRERSNEDNIAANYNGLEDLDMFENWNEYKEGDPAAADEFKDFVYGDHTWDEWQKYINVESFANLMAINYWVYNADFPMNNVIMWRRTIEGDNRWQWLVKDCDYGCGLWNDVSYLYRDYDSFLYSNVGPYVGFDIYQNLMLTEFRDYYINRLIVYMGDFMKAKTFNDYIDEIVDTALEEMQYSHYIWGSDWSNLTYNISFMRSWINQRDEYMPTLMQESWGLGKPVKVAVNVDMDEIDPSELSIKYNDVSLTHGVFDGYDYVGRTIKISGDENFIKGWTVAVGENQTTVTGPELTLSLDSEDDVKIQAFMTTTGINGVDTACAPVKIDNGVVYANGVIEAYDMVGRKVTESVNQLRLPAKGIYVIRANGRTIKVAW